jgi:hypothetical protein
MLEGIQSSLSLINLGFESPFLRFILIGSKLHIPFLAILKITIKCQTTENQKRGVHAKRKQLNNSLVVQQPFFQLL